MGKKDLSVICTLLGTNDFILGTTAPTSYDTDVFAFLVPLFQNEVRCENVWVKEIQGELQSLNDYVDRMRNILYPESPQ